MYNQSTTTNMDAPTITTTEHAYLESLSEKEKIAYQIAKHHLGSTFDLSKSCGFIEFKQKYETNTNPITKK